MGQITKLKDGSGVSLYPITTADAVFIEDSVTLKSRLGTLWDWYSIATDDSDSVIDTWHEISDFLAGTTDTSTLTGLLAGKANSVHNHDSVYSKLNHNHDSVYSKLNHNHDSAYAPLNHNHDIVKKTAAGFVPSTAAANLDAAPSTYSDKYFMYFGSTNSDYKWAKLPQIGNGGIDFKVGTTTAESFSANYAGAAKNLTFVGDGETTVSADASTHTITISSTVNNGTFTIQGNGTSAQTFKANDSASPTLNFVGSGATKVSATAGNATTAGQITISTPSPKDGTLSFKVGDSTAQSFGANSDSTKTLTFAGGGATTVSADSTNHKITISTTVNNGRLTIQGSGTSAQTFDANQSDNATLNFVGGNGIGITPGAGQITISSPINHDTVLKTTGYTYSTIAQDTTILNTIKNALP